jgi:hypothetical protein
MDIKRRLLAIAISATLALAPAYAQTPPTAVVSYSNSGATSSGGGTGTLTQLNQSNGISLTPNPITTTGTIATTDLLGNGGAAITGTIYAVQAADAATELLFTGTSASAWTLQAPSGSFATGFGFSIVNRGTASITLTATGNINGASTLVVAAGASAWVFNDSTTWWAAPSQSLSLPLSIANGGTGASSAAVSVITALGGITGTPSSTTYLRGDGTWSTVAGGSGCTVSGTAGQAVYNNGSTGCLSSAATFTSGGGLTLPVAGAASTPGLTVSGVPFAGTGTTSFPQVYINSGSAPTTFATGGTALGINEPSGFAGNAIDLHANGGASIFSVNSAGAISTSSTITATGNITSAGNLLAAGSGQIRFNSSGIITSPAANSIQIGPTTSGASAAQTLSFNSGAGTNIAGSDDTFQASKGSGTAAQGRFIFTVGATTTSGSGYGANLTPMTMGDGLGAATVFLNSIVTDATHTDSSVCQDTTTHGLYFGSGTLGICLGTSSIRFKKNVVPMVDGLKQIEGLKPVNFNYNDNHHGDPKKLQYGFIAEQAVDVLPNLVGKDSKGKINTFDYMGLVPVLVKAVQQQQVEIAALQAQLAKRH